MNILKHALKIHAPANRAIVKHTTVDEVLEIVEFGVAEFAPWHKEFPLSRGDCSNVADDPVNKEYQDKNPFALMRSPVLLPFSLLVVMGSLAMWMILVSGTFSNLRT